MKLGITAALAGLLLSSAGVKAASSDAETIAKLKAENAKLKQQLEQVIAKPVKSKAQKIDNPVAVPATTGPMQYAANLNVQASYDNWSGSIKNFDTNLQPTDSLGDKASYIGLSGRALLPITGSFGVQIDGADDEVLLRPEDNWSYTNASQLGAHALYRTDKYQFGAFGGLGNANVLGSDSHRSHFVGLEAQAYFDHATLWAQTGRLQVDNASGTTVMKNIWQLRSGVRYFIDDQTRVDVEAGYVTGRMYDYIGGSNADDSVNFGDLISTNTQALQWKIGIEKSKLVSSYPVSVFANYSGSKFLDKSGTSTACDAGCDSFTWQNGGLDQTIRVGLSLKFGPDSLYGQDRHGVNTDLNFATLPTMRVFTAVKSVSLNP